MNVHKHRAIEFKKYRLKTTISSGRTIEKWENNLIENIWGNKQASSIELITIGVGHFHNTFTLFFDNDEDIILGDRLEEVISGLVHQVQGVQDKDYGNPRINHLKVSTLTNK
jgi:hypothetical protein